MKTLNIIYIAIAVVVVGVGVYLAFTLSRGTLNVTIDDNSLVKNNVHFWISKDNFQKQYSVPGKVSLNKGNYTISALGENSAEFRTDFTITAKQQTNIVLSLDVNPQNNLEGTTDGQPSAPYYSLFPHDTGEYLLEATLNEDQSAISKITLTIYHQIPNDQTTFFNEETDLVTNTAKKWLSNNGVPDTIPVEIVHK